MKKSTKSTKNVIKALTTGLAILMAAQPITAAAAELPAAPDTQEDLKDVKAPETKVADEVKERTTEATETIDSTKKVVDDLKTALEDTAASETSQAVQDALDTAVEALAGTDAEGKNAFERTADDLASVDEKLTIAAQKDAEVDDKSASMINSVNGVVSAVDNLEESIEDKASQASTQFDLVKKGTYEQADAALSALSDIANETKEEYLEAVKNVSDLEEAYNAAKAALAEAQKAYSDAIGGAKEDLAAAEAEMEAAYDAATELKDKLSDAEAQAKVTQTKQMNIINAIAGVENNKKASLSQEEAVFKAIMSNYYINEVVDENATNIKLSKITNYSENYKTNVFYKAQYTVDGKKQVKYYGFTMEEGSANSIQIYEKDSVEADAYTSFTTVVKYTKDYGYGTKTPTTAQYRAEWGNYDKKLFTYSNGRTGVGVGLSGVTPQGVVASEDIVFDANNNAAYYEAGNGLVQSSDQGLKDYLASVTKYEGYLEQADTAIEAVSAAKGNVDAIEAKIDSINDEAKTANISNAQLKNMLVSLVSQYDDTTDFSKLSVEELTEKLDEILENAKAKLAKAEENLDAINEKLEEAEKEYARFSIVVTQEESNTEDLFEIAEAETPLTATPVKATTTERMSANANIISNSNKQGNDAEAYLFTEVETETLAAGSNVIVSTDGDFAIADENTTLGNSATALSAGLGGVDFEPVEEKMPVWWTVIIAVLGTFGVGMYKRHLQGKASKEENSIE